MTDKAPESKVEAALQYAICRYNEAEPQAAKLGAFLAALDRFSFAIVACYNPDYSVRHPLGQVALDEIAEKYETTRVKRGHAETWQAVYNECIRQGEMSDPPTKLRVVSASPSPGQNT